MITMTAEAAAAIRGPMWIARLRVESWRGGQLLAEIPATAGTHETDRSGQVPDRVTLTVPRVDAGTTWDPGADPDHPLAPYGQRLRILAGVELAHGAVEWIPRGWFLVDETAPAGDQVTVQASGLLQLVAEAKFTAPFQASGTFVSTLRQLVEPALTVDVTAAPTDRAVPAATWDDRIAAMYELLDAWPAAAVVDPAGVLVVTPAVDPTATDPTVADLTTSTGTTVISATGTATRAGAATVVVARGTAADGTTVQAVASDTSGGPLDSTGPFNSLPVPEIITSPLLTTVDQCRAAAQTVLARRLRTGRRIAVDAVPHPGLRAGDLVALDAPDLIGVVETLALPLGPSDTPMRAEVRVLQ